MIPNEEKERWHYLAVKKLTALLYRKTSKHHGDFCLNCLHSFRTENKLKSHNKVCKNNFCGIVMPSKKNKILEFKQYVKSNKMPYFTYVDIGLLIRKTDGCVNNPEKSSTMKIDEHIPCGYSMSIIWRFNPIEDKHILDRKKRSHEKVLSIFKRTSKKYNWFWKGKNLTVNKRRIKIIYRCRCMLYLQNKIHKKSL